MKSRISQVLLQSVLVVLVGVVSVSAEEKTSWFSNPFSIGSGSESVPAPGGGYTTEQVTLLTPSRISYDRASPVTHFGVGYQPEFELRFGAGRPNSWNHSADASFGHRFSRRTKLDFGHSFVKSSDPGRIFTDNIFVMPRDSFRENASAVTLSHETSARTTLNFRFDNTFTRMSSGGDTASTILSQYAVAGTAGMSQHLSPRNKITFSYSLLKFSPYQFDNAAGAAQFAANIPTVKAGIARFAAALATSVSRSSPAPTGIAGGAQQSGSSSGPTASSSGSPSSGLTSSTSVSVAGQDAGVAISTTPLNVGATATVAVPSAVTTAVGAVAPAVATVISAVPTPPVSATVPVSVAATVTVPVPAAPVVVVQPPTVPLVPVVTAPIINPTLPLVGIVTPLPTVSSASTPPCELLNNTCSTTATVTTASGATSISQVLSPPETSIVSALAITPTAAAPTATAAPSSSPAGSTGSSVSPGTTDSSATQSLQLLGRPFHVFNATYTYTMDPGLLFEVSGGAMRDRDMSYLLGLQVERRFTRVWLAAGYQRFLSLFGTMPFQGSQPVGTITLPNGVNARSVFSALTGRVGGKLNRRTDLEMSLSLSKSSANFVVHDVRSTIGRARINYWLSNRVSLFANVDSFYESGSEVDASRFSRHRYFGGLQVRLSSATAPAQMAGK